MATATSTTKLSNLSKDVLIAVFAAVIAGIKANLTLEVPITFDNASTTWEVVATLFQTYVDRRTDVVNARLALTQAVAVAKVAEVAAMAKLKPFKLWALSQYGVKAYSMFGLPQPKVPAPASTVKKAISTTKRKATTEAKKAALASIAPPDEEAAVMKVLANAVGSSPAAAPATAPAANPPVTPTHS